jgi:hypothetical protein
MSESIQFHYNRKSTSGGINLSFLIAFATSDLFLLDLISMPLLHVSFFQIPLQKPLGFNNFSVYLHIGSTVDASNIKIAGGT